ncbi:MAG: ATP-binding protein [Desulfobacterales bacterium]|jgi:two-component system NtrC family sensor kinase
MKATRYARLQRIIVLVTLLVSFTPLLILGVTIYLQFYDTIRAKIEEQLRYRAQAQATAVDLFLKERSAILSAMADTHSFQHMLDSGNLARVLEVMNTRAGAFVDLGVIDSRGRHRAYVGPYALTGLRYDQEPWFAETMARGLHISDVYMGFRRSPHFIIALRRQEQERTWILRATVDSEVFGNLVRAAHVGRTGDAYIVNRSGVFQTAPRFAGKIMEPSEIDPQLFGGSTTVIERKSDNGFTRLISGAWLKNNKWLLVVSQGTEEEMSRLFATRATEILIISVGMVAILLATVLITGAIIDRLRKTDQQMNELNAQLIQSDKLAALGKMAAGVAHEINNPLAVILQKTGWMEDLLEEEEFKDSENLEELKTSIRKIEEHVDRARKVVQGMLGYARKMEPHLEDVDVNAVVNQTIDLLQNYARINDIEIRTEFGPKLPIIASDQSQLQQVFLNLMTNAIDAIGKDGLIRINTEVSRGSILVRVEDDGPGMTEEQQRRVFDPFFTTKAPGKGTGLGLWISHSIIEKMGGTITVLSRKGEGSTFTVQIPIVLPEKK